MQHQIQKSTGISLSIGSLLAILTMVVHPVGGSIPHLIQISDVIIGTHALAIFCLPFILFGFYGLTIHLMDRSGIVILAFIIMAFGLIAAMCAAAVNGLTLPYFLGKYADTIEVHEAVIQPIMSYSFALNKSLDFIFIVASFLSIALYSVSSIRTKKLPLVLVYVGIGSVVFVLIGALTGFVFTSLTGFRIVVFSLAGWILSAGIFLIRSK